MIPHSMKKLAKVIRRNLIADLVLIGAFVRSYPGRPLYRLGENILVRIPLFNRIYVQVRHISETIFSQRETMFNEVAPWITRETALGPVEPPPPSQERND